MNRPCDFCNRKTENVKIVPYYSAVYKQYIKVTLCEKCIKKEDK